ncbi:hypothetical protein SSS_10585 [Sarcoptes scabiei]|uniref:Uncharacterized protein n=1 Tax=Sarcoptes scabiei TaxID=52283 RepID=A0A834VBG3_SARSC|nr:hypothetical protein SSS_10585 [Sarcoptes scabiei]UXI15038.1 hypothetical protein NH340_JMT00981 [Sarcoptes scabiei]
MSLDENDLYRDSIMIDSDSNNSIDLIPESILSDQNQDEDRNVLDEIFDLSSSSSCSSSSIEREQSKQFEDCRIDNQQIMIGSYIQTILEKIQKKKKLPLNISTSKEIELLQERLQNIRFQYCKFIQEISKLDPNQNDRRKTQITEQWIKVRVLELPSRKCFGIFSLKTELIDRSESVGLKWINLRSRSIIYFVYNSKQFLSFRAKDRNEFIGSKLILYSFKEIYQFDRNSNEHYILNAFQVD